MSPTLLENYRRTRRFVMVACGAVAAAGLLILSAVAHHVSVPCRGSLEEVPVSEAQSATTRVDGKSGLLVDYESGPKKATLTNVSVRWVRTDGGPSACGDLEIDEPIASPSLLEIDRVDETGIFVVKNEKGRSLIAFRKTERDRRILDRTKLLDGSNVGLFILLGALGALAFAAFRILRARGYVTRIHTWRTGTLRSDGLVESENGATMGRLAPEIRMRGPDVLVDPAGIEGRDVYREVPLFERGHIAFGTHERWLKGTYGSLRDARTLAVIATVTTVLAVIANQFAG